MNLSTIVKAIIDAYENGHAVAIEMGDNPFDTTKITVELKDIIAIEELTDTPITPPTVVEQPKGLSIVEQILACGDDIKTAIRLADDPPTQEQCEALDTLLFAKRKRNVIAKIEQQLATKRTELTVQGVLTFMCENILGTSEMPHSSTEKQESALIKAIDESIAKLDDCPF